MTKPTPKAKSAAPLSSEEEVAEEEERSHNLPTNWPAEITFLTSPTYSPAVDAALRLRLSRTPSYDSASWTKLSDDLPGMKAPSRLVEIRNIDAPGHPARGQRGIFATQHLLPDQLVLLYMGLVHTNAWSDTDGASDYDLSLDRDLGLSVDARKCGNESRHANDYRGVAERPNAEFRDCYVQVPSVKRADGSRWERRVGIFVLSAGKAGKRKAGIQAREEILVSYGKGFWEGRKLLAKFRKDAEMLRIAEFALEH